MMQQSGGSQPSPQQFLGAYASGMEKDDNIKKLQAFRIPEAEDVLVRGAQSMTTADALAGKV